MPDPTLTFRLKRDKLSPNTHLWKWERSEKVYGKLSDSLEKFMARNKVFANCTNIWKIEDEKNEQTEDRIVVQCELRVVVNSGLIQYIVMPISEFEEHYVENDMSKGIPPSEFFCSLLTSSYFYDTVPEYRESFSDEGHDLIEKFKDITNIIIFKKQPTVYDQAIELVKDDLEDFREAFESQYKEKDK